MVDPIGDLDANTTIIVPVKITLKTRTKQSFVCRMLLIYDYLCGDVRSNSVGVSISGGCGVDGGGGGSGGSGGSYAWSKNIYSYLNDMICSTYRKHFQLLSSCMTYHWVCN